jgi:hypothetical protein
MTLKEMIAGGRLLGAVAAALVMTACTTVRSSSDYDTGYSKCTVLMAGREISVCYQPSVPK